MNIGRALLVITLGVAACAPSSSPASSVADATSSPAARSTTPAAEPSPSAFAFESATYHYSVRLPGGWSASSARLVWDGTGAPGYDTPMVDGFSGPAMAAAFAFGAPTTKSLSAYVASVIADNFKDHGDTCPAKPEFVEPVTIADEPGTLVGWNCGILINVAAIVHQGTGYHFVFRDPAVQAATDPTDKALFLVVLSSVTFGP
jgi:hypothetical protein